MDGKTVFVFIAALLFFAGCSTQATTAPDFEATTIDGQQVSMQDYIDSGKPTIVYFTASWCPTCAQNWPSLEQMYQEYGDQVNIVSISIDPTDTADVLTELAQEEGLTYPSVPGNPQIMVDFGVSSQASTVGVNRDGTIAFVRENQVISAQEYEQLIQELLNG